MMKIGVHPSNLHLRLARNWPDAFAALDPTFVDYLDGRETDRLLVNGSIDVGGTGSTPPILAEAQGRRVVYIAASAPRPSNGAIFVKTDSDVYKIADLKGRRVTLVDGSFHNYLLAKSLEAEGLHLPDVQSVEAGPGDSLEALLDGKVDAWIAMAPKLEQALRRKDVRPIARCGATIPNRSVFWTLIERKLSPRETTIFTSELNRVGCAVVADLKRAAARLVGDGRADADLASWEAVLGARDFHVGPADATIIAEQQAEADTLFRHGYLLHPLKIGAGATTKELS